MSSSKDATDLPAGPSHGASAHGASAHGASAHGASATARAGHEEALIEDAYAAQAALEAAARAVVAARAAEARAQRAEEDLRAVIRALVRNAGEARRTKAALRRAENALAAAKTRHPELRPPSAPLTWADHSDAAVVAKSALFDARFYAAQLGTQVATVDLPEHYVSRGWRLGLNPGPYYHTTYYLARYPDIADTGRCPLAHFVRTGAREMRSPHPLFDAEWYVEQHPEAGASGDPLRHYLDVGASAGHDPHPMFCVAHYLDRYGDLRGMTEPAFMHFLRRGGVEGRTPHPMFDPDFYRETYGAGIVEPNLLMDFLMAPANEERQPHGAFETAWYLNRYPAARASGLNPAVHFLKQGEALGFRPNPVFDPDWYNLESQAARADAGALAATADGLFFHYLERGGAAGLRPHPLFELDHYRSQARTAMEPLAHFLSLGGPAGLSPHPLFDTDWYLRRNPVVAAEGRIALIDYIETGSAAGRNPNPVFDIAWYRAEYDDIRASTVEPLAHYSVSGQDDGRKPTLLFDPAYLRREKSPVRTLRDYLTLEGDAWPSTHALFDAAFYMARYPDVAASGLDPLTHFLQIGAADLRDCCPLFDAAWYAARYQGAMKPTLDPLSDYLLQGWKNDRWPNRYFDPRWYRDICTAHGHVMDMDVADLDPLTHYLRIGEKLALDPHPLFDGAWYARRIPAALDYPGGALAHFLRVGDAGDLAPNALFDARWYRSQYPIPPEAPAFRHYVDAGAAAFAQPTPLFAPKWYLRAGENPPEPRDALAHYIHRGEREGRRPNPHFDPAEYRARRTQRLANATSPSAKKPEKPLRWRKDAPLGPPASAIYVSIVAFLSEIDDARRLAQSIHRFNPNYVVRLTLLDLPAQALGDDDAVFDEVRDLAGINVPALKPWLFGLTHGSVAHTVQLVVLRELLERPDCAAAICVPTHIEALRPLNDLTTPLSGAAVCVPLQATAAGVGIFSLRPHHEGLEFLDFLLSADDSIATTLARAPMTRDGIHLLNDRHLVVHADDIADGAMFACTAVRSDSARGPWTFDVFDNGAPITDGHRALYRDTPELRVRFPDPYATEGDGGLYAWALGRPGWRGTAAAPCLGHETELAHYVEMGRTLRLKPAPWFDEAAYLARYPDVAAGAHDAFTHYVMFGAREGRDPGPNAPK